MGISHLGILNLENITTANLPAAATANEGSIAYDATTNTIKFSDGSSWANIGVAGSTGTLDQAYDTGGAGAGAAITADSGAVAITVSNTSNNAGLTIAQNDSTNNPSAFTVTNAGSGADITAPNYTLTNGAIAATSAAVTTATITTATITTANITSMTLGSVDGFTLSGDCTFTTSATTGQGLLIDGSSVTSGDALRVETDAATLTGGNIINCTVDGTSVFDVDEDGSITISGTAASDAITLTAGDISISNGTLNIAPNAGDAIDIANVAGSAAIDLNAAAASVAAGGIVDIDVSTGTAPIIACNASGTYTGDFVAIDTTTAVGAQGLVVTGAGTRTVSLIEITDTPEGAAANTIDLNITPAAGTTQVIDIDIAGTDDADILTFDFAAAYTGSAIVCTMANAVAGTAIELVGSGARTVSLIEITDTPAGANANTIDLNLTPAAGTVACIAIDVAGTDDAVILEMNFAAAYAGTALDVVADNVDPAFQGLVIEGDIAPSGAVTELGVTGIPAAGGHVLLASSSAQPAAANVGVCGRFLETGAAQATSYAVQIDSTNNEALNVSTGRAHFAESTSSLASNAEGIAANYVQAAGAPNAITVAAVTDATGTTIPLADGLKLTIDLAAQTLQAGANTLNYAGGGAVAITLSTNPAANLGTAYAANGVIEVVYSAGATSWLCLSQ
jgi:hypothetical protein